MVALYRKAIRGPIEIDAIAIALAAATELIAAPSSREVRLRSL